MSSYILSPCPFVIQKNYCAIVLYILPLSLYPIAQSYIFRRHISCDFLIDASLKLCSCNLNLPLSILFYLAYCPILLRHIILIKVSADTNLLNRKILLGPIPKSQPKYFIPILLLCCILQKQLAQFTGLKHWSHDYFFRCTIIIIAGYDGVLLIV